MDTFTWSTYTPKPTGKLWLTVNSIIKELINDGSLDPRASYSIWECQLNGVMFVPKANGDPREFEMKPTVERRLHPVRYEVYVDKYSPRFSVRMCNQTMYGGPSRFWGKFEEYGVTIQSTNRPRKICPTKEVTVYQIFNKDLSKTSSADWGFTRTDIKKDHSLCPCELLDGMEAVEAFNVGMFLCMMRSLQDWQLIEKMQRQIDQHDEGIFAARLEENRCLAKVTETQALLDAMDGGIEG